MVPYLAQQSFLINSSMPACKLWMLSTCLWTLWLISIFMNHKDQAESTTTILLGGRIQGERRHEMQRGAVVFTSTWPLWAAGVQPAQELWEVALISLQNYFSQGVRTRGIHPPTPTHHCHGLLQGDSSLVFWPTQTCSYCLCLDQREPWVPEDGYFGVGNLWFKKENQNKSNVDFFQVKKWHVWEGKWWGDVGEVPSHLIRGCQAVWGMEEGVL